MAIPSYVYLLYAIIMHVLARRLGGRGALCSRPSACSTCHLGAKARSGRVPLRALLAV